MATPLYQDITFPDATDRPFFYSNFVMTADGKAVVKTNPPAYWPLGTETDRATLYELRAHGDALIHGSTTALSHKTIDSLAKPEFQARRAALGKSAVPQYVVISSHPELELVQYMQPVSGQTHILATTTEAEVPKELAELTEVVRLGSKLVDLSLLAQTLLKRGAKHVLVEGGPSIMGSFLAADLIDELFLTLAPKIFGNAKDATLTIVEGHLFEPEKIKKLELISAKPVENEVYLHYCITR